MVKRLGVVEKLSKIINYQISSNNFLNSALSSKEQIIVAKGVTQTELIVSFTTYSKRIHDVHLVIESIAQQTLKPNRLILWLDEEEFTLETIPLILHKQIKRGLEVRFCPNYRSYKKLIPTLQLFPDANIITIDDDVLYPHDMIEMLVKEHCIYPKYIIGHRVHEFTFHQNGELSPYKNWVHQTEDTSPSLSKMAIGIGGVFYPRNALNEEVFNIEKLTELSPFADDIWFKAMALLNNTKCKKVNDDRDFFNRFLLLPNSQDIALYQENIINNDKQLNAVFNYYHLTDKKLFHKKS